MVSLKVYVNNKWEELELDNKFVVSMNASLSSLVNPTDYLTDYTKTVEIPLTAKNRKIFNEYVETNSLVVGNRFDPTKPVKVKISSNNSEIFDGYLQVSKVDLSANKLAGNIYGFMNQFFTKLNALNFDDGSLPEMLSPTAVINKEYVYNCWAQQKSARTLELKMPGETGHNDIDIVGFAPTIQGNPAQFNTESGIWGQNNDEGGPKTGNFWELLGEGTLTDDQIKSAQTIIKVPSERITCQFRSYTQKPYIVMNKLIQLFRNVAEEKTGCELVLDPDFFNDTNPLYTDVIYTLPSLTTETSDNDSVHSEISISLGADGTTFNTQGSAVHTKSKTFGVFRTTSDGTLQINGNISNEVNLNWHSKGGGTGDYFRWNGNAGIKITLELYQQGVSSYTQRMRFKYSGDGNSESETDDYKLLLIDYKRHPDSGYPPERNQPFHYRWTQQTKSFAFKWEHLLANTYYYVKLTYEIIGVGSGQYAFGRYFTATNMQPVATQNYNGTSLVHISLSGKMYYTESKRSNSSLSLTRLWHEVDGTPFEVVMKYCKMLNLVFDYDNRAKKVTLMTRQKYFANSRNNIKDWSNKLDTTRDYSFKPLQWDSRYVTFNYEKTDVDRLADFASKYGFEYGSKKIDTGYEFNSNNKDFFDKQLINCSATMSEYYYSIKTIHDIVTNSATGDPTPELSMENYIINRKGDKSANVSNSFYFRNENDIWWSMWIWDPGMAGESVTEKYLWYVYITDDSDYEAQANTYCTQYCWRYSTTGPGATRRTNTTRYICTGETTTRPVFSVYDDSGSYCLQYSYPRENYYNPAYVYNANENDLYTTRWKSYIEEAYNLQNKVVTGYFWLSDNDWNEFTFNKYITIGNVLYIVNKIIDYTPGLDQPTKVELIQIWDPTSYEN